MPTVNLYNIVTNDKYELPYLCDIKGKQAAADFLEISLTQFYRNTKSDKWKGKYKAVCVGECPADDEFTPNMNVLPLTAEERRIRANSKSEMLLKNRIIKRRQQSKEHYWKYRDQELAKAKERYHKKRRTMYEIKGM